MTEKEIKERRVPLELEKRFLTSQINRTNDKEELKEIKKQLKKVEKELKLLKDEYLQIAKEKVRGGK